ncbi:hypothetical protein K0M31_018779, partial [Melipona bicolor]
VVAGSSPLATRLETNAQIYVPRLLHSQKFKMVEDRPPLSPISQSDTNKRSECSCETEAKRATTRKDFERRRQGLLRGREVGRREWNRAESKGLLAPETQSGVRPKGGGAEKLVFFPSWGTGRTTAVNRGNKSTSIPQLIARGWLWAIESSGRCMTDPGFRLNDWEAELIPWLGLTFWSFESFFEIFSLTIFEVSGTTNEKEEETTTVSTVVVTEKSAAVVTEESTRTRSDPAGSIDLLAALQLHATTWNGVTRVSGLFRSNPAYYLQVGEEKSENEDLSELRYSLRINFKIFRVDEIEM